MPRDASEQPDTSKMVRISAPPPVGPPALPAYPPSPNPYLRTTLPAGQQLQPDVLRQFYNRGFPQSRIIPLPTTSQANINASAGGVSRTVATQIINQTIASLPDIDVTDGLKHGDVIWELDSAYTIRRDDFIAGNATSGTIGDLGWVFGANGSALLASQKADAFPYLG